MPTIMEMVFFAAVTERETLRSVSRDVLPMERGKSLTDEEIQA